MTRPDGLQKIWSSLAVSRYYPLTLTTFWVERRLWGLNPVGYHALNIALQALNAIVVFLLLRRLKLPGAWLAAALWAIHPVNVESVAWATELKNVQSGAFFFLSLLCFLRFDEQPRGKWYFLSLITFAAALLSKPSAVILPFVLLLLAWWQRRRIQRRDLVCAAPFFVMSAAMSLLTIMEQRGHIERAPQDWSLSFAQRFLLAGRALWFYLAKIFWPADVMFVYPRWSLDTGSVSLWLPLAGAVAVAIGLWHRRQHRWAAATMFGLGYFAIALLPVLGFMDIYYFRYSFVGDHFQYLASLGPIALLTAAMTTYIQSGPLRVAMTSVAAAVLTTLTWQHTRAFHDDGTLWRDTLLRNPDAAIAHNNLGILLDLDKKYAAATEQYREALAIKPNYLEAHTNYGLLLIELKQYKQAEEELQKALRIKPDFSKANYCLGLLYYREGRWNDAVPHYEAAIREEPGMAEAHYDLGCVWQQQKQWARAAANFQNALIVRPDYPEAHNNLGNVLAEKGNLSEAVSQYEQALKLSPDFGLAHYNLSLKLIQLNRSDEAVDHLRRVIRLQPLFPDSYVELAKLFVEKNRFAEAIAVLEDGLTANPHNPVLGNQYAWLLATCPVTELHNAPQAIAIGEALAKATFRKDPVYLDTLAAAYADAGRFDEASLVAAEAFSLAQSNKNTNLAQGIDARRTLYESRQPFRNYQP